MDTTYKIEHLPVARFIDQMSEEKTADRLRRGDVIIQASGCLTIEHEVSYQETTCRPWGRVEDVNECEGKPGWLEVGIAYWGVSPQWCPTQEIEDTFIERCSPLYLMMKHETRVRILSTGWTRKVPELFTLDMQPVNR